MKRIGLESEQIQIPAGSELEWEIDYPGVRTWTERDGSTRTVNVLAKSPTHMRQLVEEVKEMDPSLKMTLTFKEREYVTPE